MSEFYHVSSMENMRPYASVVKAPPPPPITSHKDNDEDAANNNTESKEQAPSPPFVSDPAEKEPPIVELKSAHAPRTPPTELEEEAEEGTVNVKERHFPVLSALLSGGLLGMLISLVFFPCTLMLGTTLGACVLASVASREDEFGSKVRHTSEQTAKAAKHYAAKAADGLQQVVRTAPERLNELQRAITEFNHAHKVTDKLQHGLHLANDKVAPRAHQIADTVQALDKGGLITKTKAMVSKVDQVTGVSRTVNALVQEVSAAKTS